MTASAYHTCLFFPISTIQQVNLYLCELQSIQFSLCLIMKQKFWKELKSKLCPREQWARDEDIAKCQCCGLDFSFFRRRHHCRFCGKIFCSSCCDLYINGNYLGLNEKFVRHCEFCKEEIEKIKRDLNQLTYMVQEEEDLVRDEEDEDESSSDEDNEYYLLKPIFGEMEKEELHQMAGEMDGEIKVMYRRLIKAAVDQTLVSPEFITSKLMELLGRAVVQTRMNILPHDLNSTASYMDITRQLSIKTIYGQPGDTLELIRGVVLEKTFPVKGMISELTRPQVLVIENSLDEGTVASKLKFEQLVCSQQMIVEQLQERVMNLNPDIVFVQKAVSRSILGYFLENRVCVISGLKRKQLEKVVRLSGVRRTIKNVWHMAKHRPAHLLGSFDAMHTRTYQHQSLIFLERNVGICSILVSDRTPQLQNSLKKALQLIIQFMRQMHLEKYLVYVDFEMWEDRPVLEIPRLYRLNHDYGCWIERLKTQEIQFYRIHLSELALNQEDKKMQEYCRLKDCKRVLQPCGAGRWQHRDAYSEEDHTIGHFLLIMATNYLKKCSHCKEPHRERYYFQERGLEISVRKEEGEEGLQGQELTIENMRNFLKKYKENSSIFSYFLCKRCGETLTKKAKIGKNYLKNSFYYFLQLVTNSQLPPAEQRSSFRAQVGQCAHTSVQRVLETEDIVFSMEIFTIERYRLNLIDLRSQKAQMIIEFNIKKFICELVCLVVEDKFIFIDSLMLSINSYINVLQPLMQTAPTDTKLIIQLEKLESIRRILDQLQVFVEQLKEKEKLKEVTPNTDWTFFTRETAKVDHVIRTTIDLLLDIESKLHKRKVMVEENERKASSDHEIVIEGVESERGKEDVGEAEGRSNVGSSDHMLLKLPRLQIPRKGSKDKPFLKGEGSRRDSHENLDCDSATVWSRNNSKDRASDQTERRDSRDGISPMRLNRRISQSVFSFSHVLQEQKFRLFMENMRRRRYPLKKGHYLYFSLLNYKDPVSVLAYALNSLEQADQFDKANPDSFKVSLVVTKDIPTSFDLKQSIDHLKEKGVEDEGDMRECYDVVSYLPREFEELRAIEGLGFDVYVRSLTGSSIWESKGGKRGHFSKSHDSILVIKTIKDEEFAEFHKFACEYLRHVKNCKAKNGHSLLAKIYGLYEVNIRGNSFKYVVMQNIFFELEGEPFKVYDLKGSEVNRLELPTKGERFTGLDSNFKIDKNYHPYFMQQEVFTNFYAVIEEDIAFLQRHQVIDYSLMVVETNKTLRMGIIDFMRPYHFREKIEKTYKELKYGQGPTVLPPPEYAHRFLNAVKRYFTGDKWIGS